ncbi:monodechloroaminopyrrolnitrin synthase PrnB family protein [Streptomyces spiramyceticus]|uniref:monodechloroaminopyrrolnitrin synthase PrnB family protein n=1 Tax=Streptomyces spiramyceticus TaxID=299717 RepID=UPI00237C268A|nr:monodechloroaminopyrrolnitrin synthase PrnB family protein [Streptomyces spiramyceticus]
MTMHLRNATGHAVAGLASAGLASPGLASPGLDARNEPRYRISEIREADPLAADPLLAVLPAMNRDADVAALTVALRTLLPTSGTVAQWSVVESLAAMRDLGMILGSIKRHGTEPLAVVPEAVTVLEALGRRTDMVPRDTVHHYTTWNPIGARQRMYTGEEMEGNLQDAVRMVFPSLAASLDTCAALARLEPHEPGFSLALDRTAKHVQAMVDSIDFTVANVSPVFFAQVLRPYFEEIDVAGRDYLGPAAAQVPLWLIDLTLWQCDHSSPQYDEFLAESVQYSLPSWRDFHATHKGGTSAVSKLSAAISWETVDRLPSELAASAVSLARVLRILKTFRARHIGIARKAYSEEVRLYEVGSGGAPIELLRSVLDLTRDNETLVRRATERPRTPAA